MVEWNPRANELFLNAVELQTPEKRTAYLDSACGQDAALRQAVEALLQAHAQAGSFLEKPPLEATLTPADAAVTFAFPSVALAQDLGPEEVSPTSGTAESDRTSPPLGTNVRYVGDYELLRELGRGGMGVVYQARQTSLKRLVALKMILAGPHAGAGELARFRTEAEAVARLQHPNIVQIHEIGSHEGHPYFSLEFCPGGSLADRLDGTPLPAQQAAQMVETLARAIQAAHQAGVVHRDLKPANVLLTADGTLKVTDFGLAKKLDEAVGQTASGAIMGTPSYMAPEQAEGKGKEVGPAADVYALGAILYELLTGRPPFRAASPLETLIQVVIDEPAPPRRLQSGTPKDLETICLKCLRKEPAARPGSAGRYVSALALAEDLRRFQAGEPILARPAGSVERVVKWVRRRPLVASLLAAVLLVTVLGIAAFAWAFGQALEARDEAIAEKDRTARLLLRAVTAEKDASDRAEETAQEKTKVEEERDRARFQALRAQTAHHAIQIESAVQAWQHNQLGRTEKILHNLAPEYREAWEVRHLRRLCERKARPLAVPKTLAPTCAALSPDNEVLALGYSPTPGAEATVRLWNVAAGKELQVLHAHQSGVSRLAFSPDSKRLATASASQVKIWDLATGDELVRWDGDVHCLAFSPDGKQVVTVPDWFRLNLWDASTGKQLQAIRLLKPIAFPDRLAFSPDGKLLAIGCKDVSGPVVRLYEAASGKDVRTLTVSAPADQANDAVQFLGYSADGLRLVSGSLWGHYRVWDTGTWNELHAFKDPDIKNDSFLAQHVAMSADGQRLVSESFSPPNGHALKVWDLPTGQVRVLECLERPLVLAMSTDGKRIAWGNYGRLLIWDLTVTHQEALTFQVQKGPAPVRFSGDGTKVVMPGWGLLRAWDPVSGLAVPSRPLRGQLCPDGSREIEWGEQTVTVWDSAARQKLGAFPRTGMLLGSSRDGSLLFAGAPDEDRFGVLDGITGKRLYSLPKPAAFGGDFLWSASHSIVVVADKQMTRYRVWDATTGRERLALELDPRSASFLGGPCISPDGRQFILGGQVYDLTTGQLLVSLNGPDRSAGLHLAFSPDSRRLVGGGSDHTLWLWDAATGQLVLTLKGHKHPIRSVAFSPDGCRIVSADVSGEIKVWEAP